jgi:ABC-type nitrate/sulfonate/bicarbonate transport system substrate-binding protein
MQRSAHWSLPLVVAGLLAACAAPPAPGAKPAPAAASEPAAPPAGPPTGPLTVLKAGQVAGVAYPYYIGIERGYLREQGIELQVETARSAADMVPMIANGQLDVSQQAAIPGLFNAILRGVPMKAIFDASHTDPDQHSHATMVRRELWDSGAVRTLADLVGRKVGASSPPSGLSIAVDRGLRHYGYRIDDLDKVNLSQPDMPAGLANGSIDAAVVFEPAISTALNQNTAVPLRWLSEDYPGQQIAVQVIGPSLIERPELARRFAQAYLRGARDWNDAIKHKVGIEELAQLLTPYNSLDPAINADLLRRHGFTSIDPDGQIDKESLVYDMTWYVEGGHLERPVDLDQLVDSQYAEFAAAQLGPYAPPRRP